MLVHRNSFMRFNVHSQNANLRIFELHLVMFSIDLDRVATAGDCPSCTGFLQFDLDDVESIPTNDLRRVRPVRLTPLHLTRLPIEYFRLPPILIVETLPSRLQVNHAPV